MGLIIGGGLILLHAAGVFRVIKRKKYVEKALRKKKEPANKVP